MHAPAWQMSPSVQTFPSSHAPLMALFWHPSVAEQLSDVQGFSSSHASAPPGMQLPAAQWSARVQTLPSVHVAALGMCTQPELAAQLSSVHGFWSSQASVSLEVQLPPWHLSPSVHALSSLQLSVLAVKAQPLLASQPSSVHGLASVQRTELPGVQLPLRHWSPAVQASPSSQSPLAALCLQPLAATQLSAVHGLPSSQSSAPAPRHFPPAQLSPVVHKLPSVHLPPSALIDVQPLAKSHESAVHTLPSSQSSALPG